MSRFEENQPLVSVIIPTYNRRSFILEAIESVIKQTYQNIEIIVIDDGSTDGTGELLKKHFGKQIAYYFQENKGQSTARNLGISNSRGKYIAFLDSDDSWFPEKLSFQVPILEKDLDIAAVFCQIWRMDESGQKIGNFPLGINHKITDFEIDKMVIRNRIPGGGSTCLIRRSVLENLGGFSRDIQNGEDWELWLKIIADQKIFFISQALACYRLHDQSQTSYPDIRQIDRCLTDYLLLITRIFLAYPEKISSDLYNRSLAYQYINASLASYYLGFANKGKERLTSAVSYDPGTWRNKKSLVNVIDDFLSNRLYEADVNNLPASRAIHDFGETLITNLADSLRERNIIYSIRGAIKLQEGFFEYKNGKPRLGAKALIEGIVLDPSLASFATLAIIFESMFGKSFVNRIRSIKHGSP